MVDSVEEHYGTDGIVERVVGALTESGFDIESLDPDVLAGADEFHIGGRDGTMQVAARSTSKLDITSLMLVAESAERPDSLHDLLEHQSPAST